VRREYRSRPPAEAMWGGAGGSGEAGALTGDAAAEHVRARAGGGRAARGSGAWSRRGGRPCGTSAPQPWWASRRRPGRRGAVTGRTAPAPRRGSRRSGASPHAGAGGGAALVGPDPAGDRRPLPGRPACGRPPARRRSGGAAEGGLVRGPLPVLGGRGSARIAAMTPRARRRRDGAQRRRAHRRARHIGAPDGSRRSPPTGRARALDGRAEPPPAHLLAARPGGLRDGRHQRPRGRSSGRLRLSTITRPMGCRCTRARPRQPLGVDRPCALGSLAGQPRLEGTADRMSAGSASGIGAAAEPIAPWIGSSTNRTESIRRRA